jgi:SAM-dependent methyltransferase
MTTGRSEQAASSFEAESLRIRSEFGRRARDIDAARYAPWDPAQMFMLEGARRSAATLLRKAGAFPVVGTPCLEVGYGHQGWLGVLISWGVRESDLHGIELETDRSARAREVLPIADLRRGDAAKLPWASGAFQLVVASTVFTSILDNRVRQIVADEITRVLAPGGALLWYDFAVNNPSNRNVRGIAASELKALFPQLAGTVKRVTLAPPLARFVAPRSWVLAGILETVPLLRTHLIAVLVKQS